MGVVFRYPQFYQVPFLRPRQLPLFPYTHAYAMVQPSVDVFEVVLHARYPIIVMYSWVFLTLLCVFVTLTESYTLKSAGKLQALSKPADAGEHIYESNTLLLQLLPLRLFSFLLHWNHLL